MSETKQQWLRRVADIHGLDVEDIEEIAELCLSSTESNMSILKQLKADGDIAEGVRAAHSIKGAAANIYQTSLTEAADKVEHLLKNGSFAGLEDHVQVLERAYSEFNAFFNS